MRYPVPPPHTDQAGNALFIILLAIVLIGAVTAVIRAGGGENAHIDKETLLLRVTQVKQYASELERGVRFVMNNGPSESDLRFAHPDADSEYGDFTTNPSYQIFQRSGGGAQYRLPPDGVNDGSAWEFYGNTHLPEVGSARAELIAVLPNVTEEFCDKINALYGYSEQPDDTGTCLKGADTTRFDDGTQFDDSTTNTVDAATFSVKPSMQACVLCDDDTRHFYHVLMAR